MRWLSTFVALCLGLCAVILAASWGFTDLLSDQGVMGLHGWIAMGLGIVLTSALGVGLMKWSSALTADGCSCGGRLTRKARFSTC